MAVTTTKTNKPINPRGNDQSPKGYNRAELYTGKALDFDGVNDSVNLDGFTMTGTTATFAFNVNFDAITINQFVFDLKPVRFVIGLSDITGNPFGLYDNSQWQSFGDLEPNQWHNVSISIDGTSAKMYLNGQSFGNETTMANAIDFDSATEVAVGSNFSGGGGLLNGQIAGFKIFNTALTAAQVADLYNNPEKVVPTGVDNTALKLWLPMMEGAGTTAYDGSGNGNQGSIIGATWTHGVGSPVAQTAVIDWNKAKNDASYSEEFSSWGANSFVTITDNNATAPDGQTTAESVAFTASQANARMQETLAGAYESQTHVVSVWAKVSSGTEQFRLKCTHSGVLDYYSSDLTATTEWQRFSFSQAFGSSTGLGIVYGIYNATDLAARTIQFWGFQLETNTSSVGPYVRTGATAQTSPVLLPQGLTTGRDITGVNLFENVRKQGALNLDGNSWAEVHDNASVDLTDGLTLEAWVYYDGSGGTDVFIAKWGASGNRSYLTYRVNTKFYFAFTANGSTNIGNNASSASLVSGWNHVCVTYDGSDDVYYLNGSQDSTHSVTGSIYNSTQPIEIGRNESGANYINADIAQPRIYNRALTAEEVERNYNAGKNIYK